MQFDHIKLSEKGYLALLLEDLLISELCPLEESASHHVDPGPHVQHGWTQLESTLKIMLV